MNNKKGISAVVATVLIILITIAAVTMVWAVIRPFIVDKAESATQCFSANTALTIENRGFTCYNGTTVNVQVSHSNSNINLVGIIFYRSDNTGNSIASEFSTGLPGINGVSVFAVGGNSNTESVAIAPIISIGNSDITCEASAPVVIEDC